MQLFQNSVLNQHLATLQKEPIFKAFEIYKRDFLPKIENIKNSKEEQYQYGFFQDLFVKVLGYTLNPSPDFNLTTEQKNITNSKKADGAILNDGKVIAVIELKSTKTKMMDKIVNQAFNYKNNHPTCKYIITSNFEKLRFYIEHSDKFEEFNLFTLNEERFTLLYTLLNKESIFEDTPLSLKQDSKLKEEEISNELYKKYAGLRIDLFENLVKNNPHIERLELLENTQKLLDRMIFIFFAEDRGILPTNTIQAIIDRYTDDIESRELYHFYKIYFNAINKGNDRLKISEYNGGLFAKDHALDALVIDDEVMRSAPLSLSAYDFNSDVDVNILGHIFENSLNDIEEMKAKIDDESFDDKKSKRKKDGVFYTPEYITKYIMDNTLGTLCEAQKEELGLTDIEITIPKNLKKLNKGETKQRKALDAYRAYLLQLKILDPACGSGAFLNQALNFLLAEHGFIDESIKTLEGGGLGLYDVRKGILENNLYGVDINAEAVEIAKLSLWLRTVEKGRKLNSLAQKIKVGNSLIDDKSVVDNAFVWEEEFPEVFEQGGFDVVIGNPPYGAKLSKEHQNFMKTKYDIGSTDTASLFIKLSNDILKNLGIFSFIIPKSFSFSSSYNKTRELIWNDLLVLVDCGKVWSNVKLEQNIFISKKNNLFTEYESLILKEQNFIKIATISKKIAKNYGFFLNGVSDIEINIANKMKNNSITLNDISINQRGASFQKFVIKEADVNIIGGAEIDRNGIKGYKGQISNENITKEQARIKNNSILVQNLVAHIMNPTDHIKITACIPQDSTVILLDTINQITMNSEYAQEYIWILLNSKLINWYVYRFIYAKAVRTMHFDNAITSRIPIKDISIEKQEEIVTSVNSLLKLNKQLKEVKQNFINELELEKNPKKLQNFEELDFDNFIKEYKKAKKLKFRNKLEERNFKDEWKDLFKNDKQNALELKNKISSINIDIFIFELYELTDKEINIIMNS